ncbi:hypothetical protein N7457_006930 [Penicillium paradoxum]|uniref:uncharacterized protein n=1 Tax=Penicillium paradoxum TaxID=176176 RepID=UPI0025498C64|nr:uncharacterized protein N7457_006930 [Penicillium paradoxum]KAJ5779210.1 hypothetical protein N7457_006930 [Penicillium paradoxum]
MPDATAAKDFSVDQGDHKQPQTVSTGTKTLEANTTVLGNNSSEDQQPARLAQQERDLVYYRKFLEDLVAVMRDARSESVTQIIALIRSGASHDEIQTALHRVQSEG